ncbi:hypothetical protein HYC85_001204 [Camellia sinensis]|uniref:Uncharacterized protein n=1 Tax=Camellia sinensis TaxID=4442 RepID=A0A7J7I5B9_CAMSI|nr:hypothetical protein HYC85_001204 [Camellia sinensis]
MDATETCSSSSSSFSSSATHVDDSEDLPLDQLGELQMKNESLTAELQALQTKSAVTEENLSPGREMIKLSELQRRIDEELKDKPGIGIELEGCRERIRELLEEKSEIIRVFSEHLVTVKSVKECLVRVVESMEDDQVKVESVVDEGEQVRGETDLEEELRAILVELKAVSKLASMTEMKLSEYQEMRNKEKRELENSVVSLTEENRDINSLLRIALVEKEAVEKSLNKLKGNNNEQKRVAILQIAERGLQKVGFGFMMGTGTNEPAASEIASANNAAGSKSDGSECEEEVVSLASTVERIMKNLRLEITQLRRSLEESRSDTERLQSLTEKQAQKIAENAMYIKELEDRETMLSQNVEGLLMEIKETEEEVARWREACELEVEAGKNVVEERDKVQELEKTKAALDISNGKLKLKEELAAAAMAAQAAAERSLKLADSRAAGLHGRIEELTRQLEEAESRERNRHKVRHICWPWRFLKANRANNTNPRFRNSSRMLPEMQALLL